MDREKIVRAFENYVDSYDLNDPNIYLKYKHTYKVAKNCEIIANSLQLSKEDQDLAWVIGMLHDIGRFEQLKQFHTYVDAVSIDHALFGADLLFKEGLIFQFVENPQWYDSIEKAIRFHSLYRIPEDLCPRDQTFCQIIRDADKVDIFRANYETGMSVIYGVTEEALRQSTLTKEVTDVFLEYRAIPRNMKKTVADHLVGHIALTFELVYPKSRELTFEQGYLWKLLDTPFDNKETAKFVCYMKKIIINWYKNNGLCRRSDDGFSCKEHDKWNTW